MTIHRRTLRLGAAALGVTILGGTVATLIANPAVAAGVVPFVTTVTCSVTGANWCISGNNTSSGIGVIGTSKTGTGLRGTSTSQFGLKATSVSGTAILAQTTSGSSAISVSNAGSGDGADLSSTKGNGAVVANGANSANGITRILGEGGHVGAIIGGTDIGAIITSGKNGTPFIVQGTSSSGTGEVTIDSTGNINTTGDIIYQGDLIHDVAIRPGVAVTAFAPSSTQATIEDSGTAQLVGGAAIVRLDPAYAASIDMKTPYRVFLTPNADSHGLYVAQKTANAFIVREMQGGKGTYAFDFRVLGTSARNPTARMAVINSRSARR